MKTWLRYIVYATYPKRLINTERASGAAATPVRRSMVCGRDAGRAFMLHGRRLVPACASSFGEYPGQLRPWAGRGSGKTSRRCRKPSVPATESHCRESTRRKRGRPLNRHTRAAGRACRSGNHRHRGSNATGPVARPSPSSRGHSDAWWSPTDASHDSRPPEQLHRVTTPGKQMQTRFGADGRRIKHNDEPDCTFVSRVSSRWTDHLP